MTAKANCYNAHQHLKVSADQAAKVQAWAKAQRAHRSSYQPPAYKMFGVEFKLALLLGALLVGLLCIAVGKGY